MRKVIFSLAASVLLWAGGSAWGRTEVTLKSRCFVPEAGVSQSLRLRAGVTAEKVHVIVQLETTPTVERRVQFARQGLRLLSYIPDDAWLAVVPADRLTEVAALSSVVAITEIRPEDKIASEIKKYGINAYSTAATGQAWLRALLFEDVALGEGARVIENLGGTVLARDSAANSLVFYLPVAAIDRLAAADGVKWIDQHYESMDLNDGVRAAINVNAVQLAPYDLTGTGVIIGQWESKHPDCNHVDLVGRTFSVDDAWTVGDHATQVAGTMIGSGALLASRQYRGVATGAALVSYHSWDSVSDLRAQYQEAIETYGIDIANNSWGKVEWHVYKDYAAALDGIVRGALGKPISMVWAAGNEGAWSTILCTAVAKNVVTVGATNSDDNSLWTWSNKGPTEDGRIKPDVVAPGCQAVNGEVWSALPANRYGGACGTSLAAPSVSGTMALLLEDWRGTHEGDPLPSTLKAILLHTATDLGETGPDYMYGYGLIDARKSVHLVRADTIDEVVVEGSIAQHGQQDVYRLEIAPGTPTLKLTLVWDDWPADPLAARALVNDLDLVVTGPDERRHYPWTLDSYSPAAPAERLRADHTNNAEQVYVETPGAGTWLVTVWGTNLPQYNQSYSLIAGTGSLEKVSAGSPVLTVSGYLGETVAEFLDTGDLVLQGTLATGTECDPPAGAFVFMGAQQEAVGYIDLDGNLCLRGRLDELVDGEVITGVFVVHDWSGNVVAAVDAEGNLSLAGQLYQDSQP